MRRRTVATSMAAALMLGGCGYAVRDSVKTSGEAAERAVREWERTQSALVLAEDARNAARDAAAAAADPPLLGNRDDFIEDRADEADDRANDAKDRADDARDRARDLEDRARDAEEGAKKASGWMADRGFYTGDRYWDCGRYRGHEAFEDRPEACAHANESRALAEVVRWRANRARTVADHAQALADETLSLARRAEAARRTSFRRERLLAEAEELQTQAADALADVRATYAEQNREWQALQSRAGGWLEGAERTYATIKRDDSGGGWASALIGGAIGAAAGAAGASALGLTGSEALELATLTTVAGAEAGSGGDGTLTQAVVANVVDEGGAVSPAAGVGPAAEDPAVDEALDSIRTAFLPPAGAGRSGTPGFGAASGTAAGAAGVAPRRSPPPGDGAGGDAPADPSDALDRPVAAGSGGRVNPERPDPFAALDQAFAAERDAGGSAEVAAGGSAAAEPGVASVADPFAALEEAFAAEARESPAQEEAAGQRGRGADAALDADPFGAWIAHSRPEAADGVAEEDDAELRAAEAEPADLQEWLRVVQAGVTAAEQAAADAEVAASGSGSWFARAAGCVNAQDRLTGASARVEALTVGAARPSFVTPAAGEEAHAELGERLESARERARVACASIEQRQGRPGG